MKNELTVQMVGPKDNGISEEIRQLFFPALFDGELVTLLFEEHVVDSRFASGLRNQEATEAH